MSSPLWQSGQALTDDTITLSSVSGATYTGPYTINTSNDTSISNPWGPTQASAKIQLNGEGADIEVNGKSLMTLLESIEHRLNILTPDPKLESEWNELRELGEQYRRLEQHIKDKQATWSRLKAMPPPETD
jgi:hypothetical protein